MQNEVADTAPRWTRLSYRVLAIGTAGALATIGTWIAIGSGPRAFTLSAPFVEMQTAGEIDRPHRVRARRGDRLDLCDRAHVGTVRKFFGRAAVDRHPTRITILPKCAPDAMCW